MSSTAKKITLRSSDLEMFEVEEAVAMQSQMIKNMIDDDCANNCIPFSNVHSKTLVKIIDYCKKHADTSTTAAGGATSHDLKSFDAEFVKLDQSTLFDLLMAANFLDIKSLLNLICQTISDMIKGKSVEEVREIFNIKNDFTPEEEAEIRKELEWAFT